jgi:hypothetical protein
LADDLVCYRASSLLRLRTLQSRTG